MVGGEKYLLWFENIYNHSIMDQGHEVSFVVGEPGAGKSHFLSHLDYLFYATNRFKGIYTIYEAIRSEIDEKHLWVKLLWNNDVIKKLRQIIPSEFSSLGIRSDVKINILKLMEGRLNVDSLDDKTLHEMAEAISGILMAKNAGICIAIDNVDEYFRFLSDKYGKEKALERFLGTIRSVTTGLRQIVVLLACTTDVYKDIKSIRPDRTLLRRMRFQEETLKELTLNQCFELVHSYLQWWAERHGVSLPMTPECIFETSQGQVSIYPLTKTAVDYFYKVSSQFAGDIVCVCRECINDMKNEGNVSIVEGAVVIYALEKSAKERPSVISKIDLLRAEKAKVLKDLMAKKLKEIERRAREKYVIGIEPTTIISRVEAFVDTLGIKVSEAPQVKNYYNPTRWIVPDEYLKIWYHKDKRVAVEYIIGDRPPIGPKDRQTYGRSINLQDIFNVGSLIEAGEATHALLILYWAGGYDTPRHSIWEQTVKFGPALEEMSLDDTLFKIIGVIEEGGDDKNDLVDHVDKFYLKLIEGLDRLIQQERSPEKIEKEEFPPIRYY